MICKVTSNGSEYKWYPKMLTGPNIEPYARSIDARSPKGWIVDLINRFGYHGGFQKLLDRFQQPNNAQTLTVALIYSLVR